MDPEGWHPLAGVAALRRAGWSHFAVLTERSKTVDALIAEVELKKVRVFVRKGLKCGNLQAFGKEMLRYHLQHTC